MSLRYKNVIGTLLSETDNKQVYFVVNCNYYNFYRHMFAHGWEMISVEDYKRSNVEGYKIEIQRCQRRW